jgi:hypothetical protein
MVTFHQCVPFDNFYCMSNIGVINLLLLGKEKFAWEPILE